jgi:hypothetical protein
LADCKYATVGAAIYASKSSAEQALTKHKSSYFDGLSDMCFDIDANLIDDIEIRQVFLDGIL